jgi:hypothetical protein
MVQERRALSIRSAPMPMPKRAASPKKPSRTSANSNSRSRAQRQVQYPPPREVWIGLEAPSRNAPVARSSPLASRRSSSKQAM